ncbi:MAG: dethiobiotin synthase [Dokdonella sp.]
MTNGVFITGTDTGVGKTRVAAALAHLLYLRGVSLRPRKPVESGCSEGPEGLIPQDATTLREAAGCTEPLDDICRYRLRAPLSPERAAAREGMSLDLARLHAACLHKTGSDDFLLVEGAGGFCSPIARGGLNADLAAGLGLPVLLVAADRLGTLNHTLLTVEAVRMRGLRLVGVILNQPTPQMDPTMDNAEDLEHWLQLPVLRLSYASDSGTSAWRREAESLSPLADVLLSSTNAKDIGR